MTEQRPFHSAHGVLSVQVSDPPLGDDGAAITWIETYARVVPLKAPIADSPATMAHWTAPVVEIRAAEVVEIRAAERHVYRQRSCGPNALAEAPRREVAPA
jgi:hypothetical protein